MDMDAALKIGKKATSRLLSDLSASSFADEHGTAAVKGLSEYKEDIAITIARCLVSPKVYARWAKSAHVRDASPQG